ncbi:MAG: DUF924 family protein, partial [Pseudomonadota bacterium]
KKMDRNPIFQPAHILEFWFELLRSEEWFKASAELDIWLTRHYRPVIAAFAADLPGCVWRDANPALAAIIMLDQFPRNVFRGLPQAFAFGKLAVKIAQNAVDYGFDRGLGKDQRLFMYMPFMHSEDLAVHERALPLFDAIDGGHHSYAHAHYAIIKRFGRYPHRNQVLGRISTKAELDYLETADRFGQ